MLKENIRCLSMIPVKFQSNDIYLNTKSCGLKLSKILLQYGSGHEGAAVLLPGFCYHWIAKPGYKTATPLWLDPYVLSNIKTVPSIPFCFQTHHILINLDVRTNSQKKDDEEAGLTKQGMMS